MRSVENTYLVEQDNSDAATFTLADLSAQFFEECFDILPLDICICRVSKDQFERSLILSLHAGMVPLAGINAGLRARFDCYPSNFAPDPFTTSAQRLTSLLTNLPKASPYRLGISPPRPFQIGCRSGAA